jgi:tetratricopeptide (TPR) repeat protein
MRRADAFGLARKGDAGAVPKLLAIVADSDEGPLTRANALGYLSRFSADARVFPVFEWALGDDHPAMRATAALLMPGAQAHKAAAINALAAALSDKVATVRLAAVVSLVGLGVRDFKPPLGERFQAAMKLYEARAALNNDDSGQQLAAGRFYLLTGDAAKASEKLGDSLKLDPGGPAQYFLAYAYAQQGKYEEARAVLGKIAATDADYAKAQALLKAIAGK